MNYLSDPVLHRDIVLVQWRNGSIVCSISLSIWSMAILAADNIIKPIGRKTRENLKSQLGEKPGKNKRRDCCEKLWWAFILAVMGHKIITSGPHRNGS